MTFVTSVHYRDPEIFAAEYKNIFSNQWLFACMTTDVQEQKDYVVMELMGRSVIIYNSRDGIKAFQNVCPHRFNLIFTEPRGNSPLICRYHAWGFDQNGKLIGKDKKKLIPSALGLDICLKQYRLAFIGKFIFINFSPEPILIEEQMGELYEDLLFVSDVIDEKIYEGTIPHRVNWKFFIENSVDFKHCKSVHDVTFGTVGGCQLLPEEQRKVQHNSYFVIPTLETESTIQRAKFMKKHFPRKMDTNKYKHILVFPNLTISILDGFNIILGQVLPVDVDNTNYYVRFYTSELINPKPMAYSLKNQLKDDTISFINQVFAEDKAVLENLQRGVKELDDTGYVYESETRIRWFLESYEQFMKGINLVQSFQGGTAQL